MKSYGYLTVLSGKDTAQVSNSATIWIRNLKLIVQALRCCRYRRVAGKGKLGERVRTFG